MVSTTSMSEDHIDLGEEIGYVNVTIAGKSAKIDIYNCYLLLVELYQRHEGDGRAYMAAVAEYLLGLGYPPVSDYAAQRFEQAIFKRMEELKKKEQASASPDLPASTAPESSDSAPVSA